MTATTNQDENILTNLTPKSFADIESAAESGDADAQYNLATIYKRGYTSTNERVKVSNRLALKWCKMAAQQNHMLALFELGKIYYFGLLGSRSNKEKTAFYWKAAADQGHFEAARRLYNLKHESNTEEKPEKPDYLTPSLARKLKKELLETLETLEITMERSKKSLKPLFKLQIVNNSDLDIAIERADKAHGLLHEVEEELWYTIDLLEEHL